MLYAIFLYLLKASLYLGGFALVYRLFLARLTHFHWMRFYLAVSVLLSLSLPFIQVPVPTLLTAMAGSNYGLESSDLPFNFTIANAPQNENILSSSAVQQSLDVFSIISFSLVGIYLLGVLFKLITLGRNLYRIWKYVAASACEKKENYSLVHISENSPPFSFWRYVFISNSQHLSTEEWQQVREHELVHVRQKHTLDLLFLEISMALFWFNPAMHYLKRMLLNVHEFLADATVVKHTKNQKQYAHLLLRLSQTFPSIPLANAFSNKQITQRIQMLTRSPSLPKHKLAFLALIPVTSLLLVLSSCLDEPQSEIEYVKDLEVPAQQAEKKIGKIIWEGNTVYSDEVLTDILGVKQGDVFDKEMLKKNLYYNPDELDVSSLYMDQGHLFFDVDIEEHEQTSGVIDLIMKVYEGNKVKFGKAIIKGNKSVSTEAIIEKIPFKTGELFSRTAIIEAQKAIANMGYFVPEKVSLLPIPDATSRREQEGGFVDIEFTVVEK